MLTSSCENAVKAPGHVRRMSLPLALLSRATMQKSSLGTHILQLTESAQAKRESLEPMSGLIGASGGGGAKPESPWRA